MATPKADGIFPNTPPPTERATINPFAPSFEPGFPAYDRRDKPLKAEEIAVGSIVWLLPQAYCGGIKCLNRDHDTDPLCQEQMKKKDFYNHPVLILGVKQCPGSRLVGNLICTIAFLDTWKKTKLDRYLEARDKHGLLKFQNTIPIYHKEESRSGFFREQGLPFLYLAEGQLPFQSYLNCQHIYDIPIRSLRTFSYHTRTGYSVRLSEYSYKAVMQNFQLEPEVYEESATLIHTAQNRLEALRRTSWNGINGPGGQKTSSNV